MSVSAPPSKNEQKIVRVERNTMLDCAPFLEITVVCTFSLSTLFICAYASRIHSYFRAHGKRYVALPLCNVATTATTMGIYIGSKCPTRFLNWGAIVFALSMMLLIVEVFVYFTHTEEEEVLGASITDIKTRLGTVLTVGKLAATISEHETQRQFYASFSKWDTLEPGNLVSFRIDPSFSTSGKHIVGTRTYYRYHCIPAVERKSDDDSILTITQKEE